MLTAWLTFINIHMMADIVCCKFALMPLWNLRKYMEMFFCLICMQFVLLL